ncbi:MAG: NfeD family protein [Anaerolineales bacterium]|jgi:membrane-bound serine protease (ClpP class)
MAILLDPNIAYILLVFGSILLLMAIVTPGTHLLEGGAIFLLALAGYAIYNLGFNVWALIVLILSLIPFIYSIQKPKREPILALSLLGVIIGSVYLFPSNGLLPAVNPFLALVVSVIAAGFLWLAVRKGMQAYHARPLQDLSALIGKTGQAKTRVEVDGVVQMAGELWSARSEIPVPAGGRVRVVSREGFVLVVTPEEQSKL